MPSPTPPGSLPKYIADGLPKQDDETLRDTQEYIDQLLADRERRREEPVTEDELPDDVDVVEKGQLDRRTNYYAITEAGEDAIQERRQWESQYVEM